jgi:predicted component of type VI protein secretion system
VSRLALRASSLDGAASGPKPPRASFERLAPGEDGSFLGRLAAAGRAADHFQDAPVHVPPIDRDMLVRLIVRNLNYLLRSRKGYDCVMRDYGIGDYEDPAHIDLTIRTLVSEIKEAITRYEPRLASPSVLAASRDEKARIQISITGLVRGEPCELQAQFHVRKRLITVMEAPARRAEGTPVEIARSLQRKVTAKKA